MNIKGNIKYISTGAVIFLLIYMFIAAIPMGSDIFFVPVWTRDITADIAPDPTTFGKPGLETFVLGNRFGYFMPDGTILSSRATGDRVSTSPSAWAVYPEDARNTPVFAPDGSTKMTIPAGGFVHLANQQTYLFLPGGDGVSQYNDNGVVLWTRVHTAPITAFNSSPKGTVIGYADGYLVCIAPDGKEKFAFYPGGSDYQVILGAAISEDGTQVACVAGIDKQRFLLINITGDQYKISYHTYLESNLRRQVLVEFEKNGDFAFFESGSALGIIDCRKFTKSTVPIEGRVVAAGKSPGNALFVILTKNGAKYTLSAIERPDHLVASIRFEAKDAFLIQREDAIFLGSDSRISRIDIRGIK